MTAVQDLEPGDVVDGPAGMGSATFIAACPHPFYPGLMLVIWRMDDGSISLDALRESQDVGQARLTTITQRWDALRDALHPQESR